MDEFDFSFYDDVINLAIAQLDSILEGYGDILEGYGDILEGYGDILPDIEESADELLSAQDDP